MLPSSTYRLQLSASFTMDDAAALTDYLDALGVGALYASPLLESAPGSNHGYDVVDPTRVSTERGGESARRALVAALRSRGLGLVVDVVPNHLGVAVPRLNPWWWDVLRHGRGSAFAGYFDVDWDAGPLLLPVLAGSPADEDDELARLRLSSPDDTDRSTELRYYEHAFPVAPGTAVGSIRDVHGRQHYRLVSWRRGAAELTYRRFFDVSTLAAVRVEDPEVFAASHGEVLRWVAAGEVDGLRVDHPDGLTAPGEYLQRLRAAVGESVWLVVEKILAVGEALPASWPVDGTTGYDALREFCGVFVDPAGAGPLTQLAAELTGSRPALSAVTHRTRRLVADTILAAEVRRVAALLADLPPRAGQGRDSRAAGVVPDLSQLPARAALCAGGRGGHRPDPAARAGRGALGAARRSARRAPWTAGRPAAAGLGRGDGQGRGGHRLLPVEPVRGAERGGR